jgi:predicted nucleic acid-binding protein|tara:strand:+ start:2131 stop:2640 length:510 start_codon:yes stop_codon:yes gene_type:complete
MLILDADGLIKLYQAGVLEQVARVYECIIPGGVYREAVTNAKERRYPDAEPIDKIVVGYIEVIQPTGLGEGDAEQPPQFGAGETEAVSLALETQSGPQQIIVSDDRRFLTYLTTLGVPFLPPSDLIVEMVTQGFLSSPEGVDALDHLRPLVRPVHYQQAIRRIKEEGLP